MLAKAWFRTGQPAVPEELLSLLRSHGLTRNLIIDLGMPECVTELAKFPGENRNSDMILVGRSDGRPVVVAVEAKADEEFGPVIGAYCDSKAHTASNVPKRVQGLLTALLGADRRFAECHELRYQLVHGCAAALIEAKHHGADMAVFVVHEFLTGPGLRAKRVRRSARDWDAFLRMFDGARSPTQVGGLAGPFLVPGGGRVPPRLPVLFGKVLSR